MKNKPGYYYHPMLTDEEAAQLVAKRNLQAKGLTRRDVIRLIEWIYGSSDAKIERPEFEKLCTHAIDRFDIGGF